MAYAELGHKFEKDFEYSNNVQQADVYIRMGFLRKLYSILAVQLVMTVATGTIMFPFRSEISIFILKNSFAPICLVLASFALLIAMYAKRYESPVNLILLFSFTIVESLIVGTVVVHFDSSLLLQALVITSAIVCGLTAYTMQSKRDFSSWGGLLGSLLLALIVGGLTNLFFGSPALHLVLSIGGAAVFACLLVYDTHLIMQRFSAEEYIAAAITLYLDIINLFLYILRILQATDSQ
uniref:Protein lifeguard 4 n=1 Tax=Schistocephalus solidus TaxID=70667 RepID=A0A0X3PCS6_SCHSO